MLAIDLGEKLKLKLKFFVEVARYQTSIVNICHPIEEGSFFPFFVDFI